MWHALSVTQVYTFRDVGKRHNYYYQAIFILGLMVKIILKSNTPKQLNGWLLSITKTCNNLKISSKFSWSLSWILILMVFLTWILLITQSQDHSPSPLSLFVQAPSHAHIDAQWTPALKHLQRPLHDFLQPQWRRMVQASARVVQYGSQDLFVESLYHVLTSGISCLTAVAWFH